MLFEIAYRLWEFLNYPFLPELEELSDEQKQYQVMMSSFISQGNHNCEINHKKGDIWYCSLCGHKHL
jgi:hypothetical protein